MNPILLISKPRARTLLGSSGKRPAPGIVVGILIALLASVLAAPTTTATTTPENGAATTTAGESWSTFMATESLTGRQYSSLPIDAYLAILERWGRHPSADAIQLYDELARRLAAEPYCLMAARGYAFSQLAERNPEALTPALVLMVPAWIYSLKTGRFRQLDDIREALVRWARWVGKQKTVGDVARRDAASVLVYFAAQSAGSPFFEHMWKADEALDLALDLSPDHRLALYLRAVSAERQGKYRKAAKDLATLASITDRPDVRLRLAIQHLRTGRDKKAEPLFEALLDSPIEQPQAIEQPASDGIPGWVSVLAYQEWARHLASEKRFGEAIELVDRGRRRHPLNERLALIAADLHRRRGSHSSASLHGQNLLVSWSRDSGETPRLTYKKGPVEDLLELYAHIERLLEEQRQPFLAALRQVRNLERGGVHQCAGQWRYLQPGNSGNRGPGATVGQKPLPRMALANANLRTLAQQGPHKSTRLTDKQSRFEASAAGASGSSEPERKKTIDADGTGEEELGKEGAGAQETAAEEAEPSRAGAENANAEPTRDPARSSTESIETPRDRPASSAEPLRDATPSSIPEPYVDVIPEGIRIDEVVEVELQQIYVSARRSGKTVIDLRPDELSLSDQGVEQRIVTFAQGDVPFTATLLLDASGSMEGAGLELALRGARTFVRGMGPYDRARILAAADRIRDLSPFVSAEAHESAALGQTLDRSSADGSTAIFDHLFLAVDTLGNEQGRRVVILLSDGFDTLSAISVDSVRQAARSDQVQVYWVRLKPETQHSVMEVQPTVWRPTRETRDETRALEKLIGESGGEVLEIESLEEVEPAFAAILYDLRHQLALGYEPSPRYGDGRWREVEIDASRSGVRLRHVAGYFDR